MVRRSATDVIGSSFEESVRCNARTAAGFAIDNTSSERNKEHCKVGSVHAGGLP